MSNLNNKLKYIDLGINRVKKIDTFGVSFEGILAGEQGDNLASWMAEKFNHNFDDYDLAIDSVYNTTHVGGSSYHHIIDGQHSVLSAFESVKDVSVDDGWAKELSQASEHLLRDTASVSGVNPFFTLTPEQFDKLGSIVSHTGISKEYLADALTVNAPELLGGSVALVASIIMAKKANPTRLSYFSGGCLLSSLVSANPMLLPIAAGSMVYAIKGEEDKKHLFVQAGKGSIVSGSALLLSSLIGGPAWLGCIAGFMTAVAVSNGLEKMEKAFNRSWDLLVPAEKIYKNAASQI
jgi:hypothetical protein